jgi:hypothetical protein
MSSLGRARTRWEGSRVMIAAGCEKLSALPGLEDVN